MGIRRVTFASAPTKTRTIPTHMDMCGDISVERGEDSMSEGVLIAIITGVCAVFGQWLISRNQSAKRKVDDAVRDARLDDRLAGVEKRLDEHNHYASKIGSIQTDIAVIKNEIKNLKESA